MIATFVRTSALVAASSALLASAASPAFARHRAHLAAGTLVPGAPRLAVSVFARGTAARFNPDGIIVTKNAIFVDYQNSSDTVVSVPSTIAKYDRAGKLLGTVDILGRCDGMRLDPATHRIWALVNNDGLNGTPPRQPALYVIDPKTLARPVKYAFPATQPHGGGYDDLAFVGGHAFVSASSPTIPASGLNVNPVLLEVTLAGGSANVRPILYGTTDGYDVATHRTIRLNLTDPDSLAVGNRDDLIMVSEGDGQVISVAHPGERGQSVRRIGLGTQLDEIAFTTGNAGTLFVADTDENVIFSVAARFLKDTTFVEAPGGTPVQSFIGTLDTTTGTLTPLLTQLDGILNPTALVFSDGSEPAI